MEEELVLVVLLTGLLFMGCIGISEKSNESTADAIEDSDIINHTQNESSENTTTNVDDETGVCSNSKYSAIRFSHSGKIGLSSESHEKLENAISEEGSSALYGISDLTCLEFLGLSETGVSDVSPLSDLRNLEHLYLGWTKVSDVSPLSDLENLKVLSLDHADVSDVSPLANLENLKDLGLESTDVSDVSPLANLENLNKLRLEHTDVPEQQCEDLKKELPDTDIHCPYYGSP